MKTKRFSSVLTAGILTGMLLFVIPLGYAQTDVIVGTGTITNSSSGYPAPYGNYYYGARHQFLVPASEIVAAGGVAGSIYAVGFNVSTINGTPLQGFEIKIGTTTSTALTTWESGLTSVYYASSYTETTGWNMHALSALFPWDGTSNLIIETCFNNTGWTDNAIVYQSTTTYNSTIEYHADASGVCANTSISATHLQRPNIKLTIGNPPTCPFPTGLNASNITSTSLDLNWTENGTATQWQIQGGLTGFPLGSGQFGLTPIKPVNIPGLDPSTSYDFYVRSICGPGDTSNWAGPYTVTTAFQCPPNAACATYTSGDIASDYSFTALGQFSSCPGSVLLTIPPGMWIDSISTSYDFTASAGGYMSEQRSWLYSPTTLTGEPTVYSGSGSSGGTYSYSRNGLTFANQATGTVEIQMHAGRTWGGSGCDPSYNKVDIGTWKLIAYYSPLPSCMTPSGLGFTVAGPSSVNLNWTENATAAQWEIEWGASGFTQGTGTQFTTTTNPHLLSGINPGMMYDFYVRSICSPGDTSSWAGPASFGLPLSGIYTIGAAPTDDFPDLIAANNAMQALGIAGAVTFNADPNSGPYTGGFEITSILGVSALNTITFNGNGSVVNEGTSTFIVAINGTSYLTLNNFQFINTNPSTSKIGISIRGGSQYINITNNLIDVGTLVTSSTSNTGIAISNSTTSATTQGNNAQYVNITGNEIVGGYYGITLVGQSNYLNSWGNVVSDNIVRDFYNSGIYLNNVDTSWVTGNEITRATRSTISTFYGIYATTSRNIKYIGNMIHSSGVGSYTAYPIYITTSVNSLGYETELINNLVYDIPTTSTFYGMYLLGT
ncbi:MAG: NosD domain-containing protein, partial [Bacteroidales bacterium]